jgi:hypothetical protein
MALFSLRKSFCRSVITPDECFLLISMLSPFRTNRVKFLTNALITYAVLYRVIFGVIYKSVIPLIMQELVNCSLVPY